MTPTMQRRQQSDEPGAVPFTRDSLDALRSLMVRFRDLQRPMPEHEIVAIALHRLHNEYCLFDKDIQPADRSSMRHLKKNSRDVLNARYREYCDLETVILRKRRTA